MLYRGRLIYIRDLSFSEEKVSKEKKGEKVEVGEEGKGKGKGEEKGEQAVTGK